jgi:hypothetical protein
MTGVKRKVRGRDWHAWAYWFNDEDICGLGHFAEAHRPKREKPSPGGKWVRVKFVPVDPTPKRKGGRK